MKYDHSAGALVLKMTDDVVCLQFKTDAAQVNWHSRSDIQK